MTRERQFPSSRTRNEVWQGYLDAERLYRYYTALAARYALGRRILQFSLGFAAVGGLARFIDLIPGDAVWISELASIAVLVIVVWDFMADYPTKASVLNSIGVQCGEQVSQWRALWDRIDDNDADEEEIRSRIRELEDAAIRTTALAGYAGVKESRRLNVNAAKESYSVLADRYAREGNVHG